MMRITVAIVALLTCASMQAQVSVLNGASFRPEQPITPGSWATAFGTFAGVTTTTAPSLPYPKTLGGVSVLVGGVESPIYFVSNQQVNFLVPYSVAAGIQSVQVRTAGATLTGNMRVVTAAPGIFVKDTTQQRPPKGAILNQDSTENTSGNMARRGQVIQIYATGPGTLNAPAADGDAAPVSPLVTTKSTPQVFINGVEAQVQFSGLAPGFAGLWQINAVIPDRGFLAGRVPVQIFMDGVDSNEVSIFVAP